MSSHPSRALFGLLAVSLLPGRVGYGIVGSRTTTFDVASESQWPDLRETKQRLHERRGEPDERIVHDGSQEDWVYIDEGLRWKGLILFLVIPIPLAVPVGREHDVFHLNDGVVQRVDHVRMTWSASACGLLGHRWGCDSVDDRE